MSLKNDKLAVTAWFWPHHMGSSALGAGSSSAVHDRKWERAEPKEQSAASAVEEGQNKSFLIPQKKIKLLENLLLLCLINLGLTGFPRDLSFQL